MRAIALLLIVAAMPANAQSLKTAGDLRRLPVATLADALLPPGHPLIAQIDFAGAGYGPIPTTYSEIRLRTMAAPVAEDFCAQDAFSVQTIPIPTDPAAAFTAMPRPVGDIGRAVLYRYRRPGDICDSQGLSFVIYGLPVDRGLAVVRALAGAVSVAGRTKRADRLPFILRSEGPYGLPWNRLGELRGLNLGALASVEQVPSGELKRYGAIGRAARLRGGELFDIRIETGAPMLEQHSYVLIRDGRVRAVDLSRSMIVY